MASPHSTSHDDAAPPAPPNAVFSLLDTDLYKLTMHCVVLKFYPDIEVTYNFTNRTPHMKFTREAVDWIQQQINALASIRLTDAELEFLQTKCTYLPASYVTYLQTFRFQPTSHIDLNFHPDSAEPAVGSLSLHIHGPWSQTILYEIPLLAIISAAYFRFVDTDWTRDGQIALAEEKGLTLLRAGVALSEFGTRRRRDYRAQEEVMLGLVRGAKKAAEEGAKGRLVGTSNVHFAMQFGLEPVGTVAHEWFMGVAAVEGKYETANEDAMRMWVEMFGEGVLAIALTDTFGTPNFLKAFAKPLPSPPFKQTDSPRTYAQVFNGVRQDSGDPKEFVTLVKKFYDSQNIPTSDKTIVFSDSLNIDLCLEYQSIAARAGFTTSFGVGTFLTNDFHHKSHPERKSVPLNIVIKLGSAAGRPAVKISDNIGKNTGDKDTVEEVKRRLGYVEREWEEGDESKRWGTEESRK